jgi:hypothetical protein
VTISTARFSEANGITADNIVNRLVRRLEENVPRGLPFHGTSVAKVITIGVRHERNRYAVEGNVGDSAQEKEA